MDGPPAAHQQPGAQQQIEGHGGIGNVHIRPGGIVPLGRDGVGDGQQEIAQQGQDQKGPGRQVQPAGLSRLLLDQNGDVLIKQIDHRRQAAQKQPVQHAVEKRRHGVQPVHRVNRGPVHGQVEQHRRQQHRKGLMQRRPLLLSGKIDAGHKAHNDKQRDLHPQQGRRLLLCSDASIIARIQGNCTLSFHFMTGAPESVYPYFTAAGRRWIGEIYGGCVRFIDFPPAGEKADPAEHFQSFTDQTGAGHMPGSDFFNRKQKPCPKVGGGTGSVLLS